MTPDGAGGPRSPSAAAGLCGRQHQSSAARKCAVLAYPIFVTYLDSGMVPRIPTAILSTGLMLAALLSMTCGLILDTVTRGRKEAKRVRYLAVSGVHATLEATRVGKAPPT